MDRAKVERVKLMDVVQMLGTSPSTLRRRHTCGKLGDAIVLETNLKHLVIPRCEVERLKRRVLERGGRRGPREVEE